MREDFYDHRYEDEMDKFLKDYVRRDEAVEYVLESSYDHIRQTIDEDHANDWFAEDPLWLGLLNIISGYDREQLRATIRREIGSDDQRDPDEMLSHAELFPIASQVSEFLESTKSPYAGQYGVGDDMGWIIRLIQLTRAFRELLFAVPHPLEATSSSPGGVESKGLTKAKGLIELDRWMTKSTIEKSIKTLNEAFQQTTLFQIDVLKTKEKEPQVAFLKTVKADMTPLHVGLAAWIAEYLTTHIDYLQLTVCIECGRIFQRVRRDNIYCSKTCQNRVAYKRKKIFEAGLLREVRIELDAIENLKRGLCVYHPRLGLGVVEDVSFQRMLSIEERKGSVTRITLRDGTTAEQEIERIRNKGVHFEKFEVLQVPGSVSLRVRFLSIVRVLSFSDLFPKKNEGAGFSFYEVEDRPRLAQLL